MSSPEFKVGDVVCLKSDAGGVWPLVIADFYTKVLVTVVWFDVDGEPHRMEIRPECLALHEPRRIDYPDHKSEA